MVRSASAAQVAPVAPAPCSRALAVARGTHVPVKNSGNSTSFVHLGLVRPGTDWPDFSWPRNAIRSASPGHPPPWCVCAQLLCAPRAPPCTRRAALGAAPDCLCLALPAVLGCTLRAARARAASGTARRCSGLRERSSHRSPGYLGGPGSEDASPPGGAPLHRAHRVQRRACRLRRAHCRVGIARHHQLDGHHHRRSAHHCCGTRQRQPGYNSAWLVRARPSCPGARRLTCAHRPRSPA